jgi:4'-phosphopantetheinyl transferase
MNSALLRRAKSRSDCHALDAEIGFFQLDTDHDIDCAAAWHCLSDAEQARAARFRFARHKNRYVRGRGYLRTQIARHLDCTAQDVEIELGAQGKPYLPGNPLYFNLSHSEDLGVYALRASGPLGIDVEYTTLTTDLMALGERCFTPHEMAVLGTCADEAAQRQTFFAFWTAKEARMKLTGEGMALDPKSISLRLDGRGHPVGYDIPASPLAALHYIPAITPSAICCLVLKH